APRRPELHPEVHLLDRSQDHRDPVPVRQPVLPAGGRAPGDEDALAARLSRAADAGRRDPPREHGAGRGHSAGVLHPAGHHARHVHGVLRHHAAARGCVRELPDPAQDRDARHGVPAHQHVVVLVVLRGRARDAVEPVRAGRRGPRRVDDVRAAVGAARLLGRVDRAGALVGLDHSGRIVVLLLPSMGMVSDIIANGSRKPIFGYHSMVFAIIGIAFLGWIVWGHHMFMSGMNPTLGSSFMVSTLVIAVPSAVKVFNWMGTMWRGNIRFHVPMLNAVAFVAMFVIGGLSGIYMAATPVDMFIHDTYFIVAHLHYVLFGGSLFALFGAIVYWYPKIFGRMMSERWGKVHFWLTFIFYNCTFFPMHITGMA